ncbi:MAG TPA: alpha/beta hydrolase, partial [Devosia sp.]|nr:alpha/beta hydrolase [Devosia sp.]
MARELLSSPWIFLLLLFPGRCAEILQPSDTNRFLLDHLFDGYVDRIGKNNASMRKNARSTPIYADRICSGRIIQGCVSCAPTSFKPGRSSSSAGAMNFAGMSVSFPPARHQGRKEEISMLRRTFLSLTAALAPLMALPARAQQSDQPTQGAAMLPAPSKSGYAPVNGVEVYYAVYGEGDPLVLLHGGLATLDMFGPNVALLAQGHQVIAIDLQAHGHTMPFDRPMSYEAMADDVAGVIQYLGFDKADVMGYSLGAGTALRVAIQHPDVV